MAGGVIVAGCFEAHFSAIPGKFVANALKVLETWLNTLEKNLGLRKFLESKSVLCFLLRRICRTFAVFRGNKVVHKRCFC